MCLLHVSFLSCCGGVLKPDVVFFGGGIPKQTATEALEMASSSDLMLTIGERHGNRVGALLSPESFVYAGTSLMVYSAFRLAEATKKAGGKVIAINVGPTRADPLLDAKFEVGFRVAFATSSCVSRSLTPLILGAGWGGRNEAGDARFAAAAQDVSAQSEAS